jgi:hypothetical protein
VYKYAIKINNEYFKEYVYLNSNNKNRYAGNTQLGSVLREGDIVDIITTEKPERFEYRRSIGNTISSILRIEKMKGSQIIIEPFWED